MKTHPSHLLAVLCGALLCLAPGYAAQAAANGSPPTQLTYQGFLTDKDGKPLGSVAPINKTIIFRIYDLENGGTTDNLRWSSQQIVTVDKGHFSVLLGQGSAGPEGDTKFNADLTGYFTGAGASDRYLELEVQGEGKIAPRLRFLPAPYAMLAKSATQLVDPASGTPVFSSGPNGVTITGTITGNGSGLIGLNPASISAGTVANPLILNNNANSFSGNGSGLTALNPANISGTLADTKLSVNVALLDKASQNFTGKLGIGTASPAGRLNVSEATGSGAGPNAGALIIDHENIGGSSAITFRSKVNRSSDYGYIMYQDNTGAGENAILTIGVQNDGDDHIALMPSGNVGIGTATPTQAKLVVVGGPPRTINGKVSYLDQVYLYQNRSDAQAFANGAVNVNYDNKLLSIYATEGIQSKFYLATSDERIKDGIGRSDSALDLRTLEAIEITDYRYKDVVASGNGSQKKGIAQQVERVYPQAVSKSTDVVPDIYQKATIKDGWVKLATNLKQGERVRLIGEKEEGIHEVLEVQPDGFRTAFNPKGEKVFVYGREVKDFRSVDYEAISMLNVSATQELARQVAALRKSEARVAELEQKAAQSEQRVAQSEQKTTLLEQKAARMDAELAELRKLIARVTGPQPENRPAAEVPASAVGK